MLKFDAAEFVRTVEILEAIRTYTAVGVSAKPHEQPADAVVKSSILLSSLNNFVEAATPVGVAYTLKEVARLRADLDSGRVKYSELAGRINSVKDRLRDELSEGHAIVIERDRAKYWRSATPLFGLDTHACFGAAIDDIEEAGNCLATDNGTATVFHLMRVMECGLKTLAKELGIPYAPSWESYIGQITKQLETPHPKRPRKVKKNLKFYKEVLGDLQSVKFVWRNPTMHIDRKYSPEEAEEIFTAVRRFMQRLAAGLPARLRGVFG
jgi:hypothetical protein